MKYVWKSHYSKALKMLRSSLSNKKKYKWSGKTGAGFIEEDIKEVLISGRNMLYIFFKYNGVFVVRPHDLNLRETKEVIKFLEKKEKGGKP